MQVRLDAGQVRCRTGQLLNSEQNGCRTRRMQDRTDAVQNGCRTNNMPDRTDAGQVGCRTGQLKDRTDARQNC